MPATSFPGSHCSGWATGRDVSVQTDDALGSAARPVNHQPESGVSDIRGWCIRCCSCKRRHGACAALRKGAPRDSSDPAFRRLLYIYCPHTRAVDDHVLRVAVHAEDDPAQDEHLLPPEYHGSADPDEQAGVLSFRYFGRNLDRELMALGFDVLYLDTPDPGIGILTSECSLPSGLVEQCLPRHPRVRGALRPGRDI